MTKGGSLRDTGGSQPAAIRFMPDKHKKGGSSNVLQTDSQNLAILYIRYEEYSCIVNKSENFLFFLKKVPEKFAGTEKSAYLCIRFRSKTIGEAEKNRDL